MSTSNKKKPTNTSAWHNGINYLSPIDTVFWCMFAIIFWMLPSVKWEKLNNNGLMKTVSSRVTVAGNWYVYLAVSGTNMNRPDFYYKRNTHYLKNLLKATTPTTWVFLMYSSPCACSPVVVCIPAKCIVKHVSWHSRSFCWGFFLFYSLLCLIHKWDFCSHRFLYVVWFLIFYFYSLTSNRKTH